VPESHSVSSTSHQWQQCLFGHIGERPVHFGYKFTESYQTHFNLKLDLSKSAPSSCLQQFHLCASTAQARLAKTHAA
jgi:hypothetical protein